MDAPVVDETAQAQPDDSRPEDIPSDDLRNDDIRNEDDRGHEQPNLATAQTQMTVEHRAGLAAVLGLAAAAVTIAWFSRALQTGGALDWLVCAVLGLVGLVQLAVLRDSRAPLLVADDQGVRVRHGVTWTGLRWQDIDHVELDGLAGSQEERREVPFAWLLGDRRIVVHPRPAEVDAADGDVRTFTLRLSATTRVLSTGLSGDLVADLDVLASGRAPVVVLSRRAEPAGESAVEEAGDVASQGETGPATDQAETSKAPEPVAAADPVEPTDSVEPADSVERVQVLDEEPEDLREQFEPVAPARAASHAVRAEVIRETVRVVASGTGIPAQRSAVAAGEAPVEEIGPIGDPEPFRTRPAADPVIGPTIAAARHRARLSVDELSERTRIRPHVLESIEVDDFEPCGGDFYARGHLRTLARIFGLDAQQLLALYDERYAHGEIEARQVFEAELATGIGGGVRAAASGPRWSLLAAAVIALGLVWGGARVFTDTPKELVSPAPVVDSAGLASGEKAEQPKTTLAPLAFAAVGASPQVVVRDRTGRILWAGQLADGQRQQIIGQAPFDVTTSNGAAVKVSYLGKPRGTVGSTSAADSRKFG